MRLKVGGATQPEREKGHTLSYSYVAWYSYKCRGSWYRGARVSTCRAAAEGLRWDVYCCGLYYEN